MKYTARKRGKDYTMLGLTSAITLVTSTFSEITSWLPIQVAAGFAVVGFGTSAVKRIIGIRRGRGRRK